MGLLTTPTGNAVTATPTTETMIPIVQAKRVARLPQRPPPFSVVATPVAPAPPWTLPKPMANPLPIAELNLKMTCQQLKILLYALGGGWDTSPVRPLSLRLLVLKTSAF